MINTLKPNNLQIAKMALKRAEYKKLNNLGRAKVAMGKISIQSTPSGRSLFDEVWGITPGRVIKIRSDFWQK